MVIRRRRGFRNRVYGNLKLFLDDFFVGRGYYGNIASGEADFYGTSLSQLFPVQNDSKYPVDSGTTAHIWQSYRKNWVSESGIQLTGSGLTSPTIASGIYINGVFHSKKAFDGVSGIAIDYKNGRIIIESGLPASYTVHADHSYKEIWIDTISRDLISQQVSVVDNTKRIAVSNVPSGEIGTLPMVLMEIANQQDTKGLQLGGGIIIYPSVFLHIISENRYDKDEIIDALQLRQFETIRFLDLDVLPEQFNYYGDFGSGYLPYGSLQNSYTDRLVFIEKVDLIENNDIAENGYYTALVKMNLRIDIEEAV